MKGFMKKFFFVVLFMVLSVFSQDTYRFVILGDRTGGNVPGIFPKICNQTLTLNPAPLFYTNVGDIVQGYTKDTVELKKQWTEADLELKAIKEKASWYPVAGNHDITYDEVFEHYKKNRKEPYYTYDIGPDRFIVLDNSRIEEPSKFDVDQMKFLKKTLAGSKKIRNLFCFYHKPFFGDSPNEKIMDSLHALFKAGGVDYVFNGHYHSYYHGIRDNIHYVTFGSSGGATGGKSYDGTLYHYGLVDVSPKDVLVRPITMNGDTLSIDWVNDAERLFIKNIMYGLIFKPVQLTWKDSVVNNGSFDLTFHNTNKEPINISLKWDLLDTYTDKQFQMDKTQFNSDVKPDSTLSYSFNFKYLAKGILTGPKVIIKVPYKSDTINFVKRPTIRKQLAVDKTNNNVKIDGVLDEIVWKKSLYRTQNIFGSLNRATDYDSTRIAFSYDNKNLYGSFVCYDPSPDSLIVISDSSIRDVIDKDDLISFFFFYDKDTANFYKVYLTPSGTILDARTGYDGEDNDETLKWNGVSERKVTKTGKGWQGEFMIPWSSFGVRKPTQFNVNCKRASRRFQKRKGNVALQLPFSIEEKIHASTILLP